MIESDSSVELASLVEGNDAFALPLYDRLRTGVLKRHQRVREIQR